MNKPISKNIVKAEKVVIKEVVLAKVQVAELGKASTLTLGLRGIFLESNSGKPYGGR